MYHNVMGMSSLQDSYYLFYKFTRLNTPTVSHHLPSTELLKSTRLDYTICQVSNRLLGLMGVLPDGGPVECWAWFVGGVRELGFKLGLGGG